MIPPGFNAKRVLVRSVVCLVVLGVAETVPHFGAVLSLIGGSSITLLAFVCPPVFYFKLARAQGPWEPVSVWPAGTRRFFLPL